MLNSTLFQALQKTNDSIRDIEAQSATPTQPHDDEVFDFKPEEPAPTQANSNSKHMGTAVKIFAILTVASLLAVGVLLTTQTPGKYTPSTTKKDNVGPTDITFAPTFTGFTSAAPTLNPTITPTFTPTDSPTISTEIPTANRTLVPTGHPTPLPTRTPTRTSTTLPTALCNKEADIIFLLDESSSIDSDGFASVITFINSIVNDIESDPRTDADTYRYGLTLFSDAVRTEVYLGPHGSSTSGTEFLKVLNNIEQTPSGFTCTTGGLQQAFAAHYRTTDTNGHLQDGITHVRKNVQSVIFLIAHGSATFFPASAEECVGQDRECQCTTTYQSTNSSSIYEQIKRADTTEYPNRVVALGVGDTVDFEFLDSISDVHFKANGFSMPAFEDVQENMKHATTCEDNVNVSSTFSPTSPSVL